MPDAATSASVSFLEHGGTVLPAVQVDAYNAELRQANGFVGDRASRRGFINILDDWRDRLRRASGDPLGDTPTEEISKKKLDKLLNSDDPEIVGIMHGAVEEFAQELATVVRRLLRLQAWRDTERIVIGGGLRASRIGEIAIGRAAVSLKGDGNDIELIPIRHDPDEAGLLGAVQLAPPWIFSGHDAILAVDIGGTNIRVGAVELCVKKERDLSAARVWKSELWRHSQDEPTRKQAVERLIKMLRGLIRAAEKENLKMAPFVGIGCPGLIRKDGAIARGGQNLPGNWESSRFNLPRQIRDAIPEIDKHETVIVMHNDAVIQGLSEASFMRDVRRWGALTIGTGLGNARFTNTSE
jgi:predicted NBD/HSP70 family sugar kinase